MGACLGAGTSAANDRETISFEEREWGYVREDFEPPVRVVPFLFEMNGYTGASGHGDADPTPDRSPTHYIRMRDGALMALRLAPDGAPGDYWLATASIRGTGCSGGQFDLFDRKHANDGHELIEWVADRSYALDGVGLFGCSYGGITGLHVASTQPPSLAAVHVGGLVGDLYRDVTFPGGIPNDVFPYAWAGVLRPGIDLSGGAKGPINQDAICTQNIASREPNNTVRRTVDEATLTTTRRTDGQNWRTRSVITYADQIEVPTLIEHLWQDEQIGGRGAPEIFQAITPDPVKNHRDVPGDGPPRGVPGLTPTDSPKLFRASNGYHCIPLSDKTRWFDYWVRGVDTGIMAEPAVELDLESTGSELGIGVTGGEFDPNTTLGFDAFPPDEAEWTKFYLRTDEALSTGAPGDEAPDSYLTGSPRQSWVWGTDGEAGEVRFADGPDVLTYRTSPFTEPAVLAGPTAAKLFIESTVPDMDLFVRIEAEYSDGGIVPLQRGVLRASHQGIDPDRTRYDSSGEITRPYHYHTHPEPVTPGEVSAYDVEVWPVAHPFRQGDRLIVRIHTPPLTDALWGYEPTGTEGVNTVYHDADRPSRLNVPLMPVDETELPEARSCDAPIPYRCYSNPGS